MTVALELKKASSGESRRLEKGLQKDLRVLCIKQQSQVLGRYIKLQGVPSCLFSVGQYAGWIIYLP